MLVFLYQNIPKKLLGPIELQSIYIVGWLQPLN